MVWWFELLWNRSKKPFFLGPAAKRYYWLPNYGTTRLKKSFDDTKYVMKHYWKQKPKLKRNANIEMVEQNKSEFERSVCASRRCTRQEKVKGVKLQCPTRGVCEQATWDTKHPRVHSCNNAGQMWAKKKKTENSIVEKWEHSITSKLIARDAWNQSIS